MKAPSLLICALLSLALSTSVQASWLDNLLGSDKDNEQTEVQKPSEADTQSNALVGNVMSQLGLSQQQAEGGLGTLLSVAQSSLSSDDFGSLSDSIPGADMLLAAVPALAGDSGMSGLLSQAGDIGTSLQGGAMVYDAFEKLGIPKSLVAPMIDVAKSYLEQNGSEGSVGLLTQGLSSLL
ncbi:DUF2780 domain-containing protein [Shewanella maritima]|uniref:DUF2780 domain-containing protein n=1 Tax=Shewanella maritima TaxID=2520507 RepID=UPI0037365370